MDLSSRWQILRQAGFDPHGARLVVAQCSCPKKTKRVVRLHSIESGHSKSCGCLQKERASSDHSTHRLSSTPEYVIWKAMKSRCNNERNPLFVRYGRRGIKVCKRWSGKRGFQNFYKDLGPRPSAAHSLERQENDGPYAPTNCVWATQEVQQNNRRNCRILEFGDCSMTLAQWARRTGLKSCTISRRLHLGWNVERALTQPV